MQESQDAPVCGFYNMEGPEFEGAPDHWMTYLAVDDVNRRCREAAAAGGTVCKGPFDVLGVARMAMVQDATGARSRWPRRKRAKQRLDPASCHRSGQKLSCRPFIRNEALSWMNGCGRWPMSYWKAASNG